MKILHVIPLSRGMSHEVLTYWSSESIPLGSVVFVPLRKKTVPGVVYKEEEAEDMKASVRSSAFALRKISTQKTIPFLSPAFIHAAQHVATFSASSTGAVLASLLPTSFVTLIQSLKLEENRWSNSAASSGTIPERLILQAEDTERLSRYRSVIRENFARHQSVYLCTPTIADAEEKHAELSRGIEEFTVLLHSSLSKKETAKRIKIVLEATHPLLIIGTGSFAAIERPDIKTIIIERENSRAYKLPARPYVDLRLFLTSYAHTKGAKLILGALPLRVETLWKYEENDLSDLVQPTFRLLAGPETTLVDMRDNLRLPGKKFELFSPLLKQLVQTALEKKEHCLLFASRRGIAPITVCQDCGNVVRALDGDSPMVLHKSPKGNVFVSHVSGEVRSAHERCRFCGSWKLEALGIGIERVETEIEKLFPHAKMFRADIEKAATHKQLSQEINKFYATPGSLLLTTERALAYLHKPVAYSAVVSIDSLLSLPEWKVSERVFSLLLKIRSVTDKHVIVQTRKSDQGLIEQALKGNIQDFYRTEIALRKALGYPPFVVLIKLSVVGTAKRVEELVGKLASQFSDLGIEPYPTLLHVGRGKYAGHALIRVDTHAWPQEDLLLRLLNLPPYVAIDVNPENLL